MRVLRVVLPFGLVVAALVVLGAAPAAAAVCTFEQATTGSGGTLDDVVINADGSRIAFTSTRNLTGGNADLNLEVFLYDATTRAITQQTSTTGGTTRDLAINADGTRIAFVSDRNLTGGNADLSAEVFFRDTDPASTIQLTTSTGGDILDFFSTSIDAAGERVAFSSNRNLVGTNADGNMEVFLHDLTGPATIQVTNSTGGASDANSRTSISDDGAQILFTSDRNLTGNNSDGNRDLYIHDTSGPTTTQLTTTTIREINNPSLAGNGDVAAFSSGNDLDGSNPDHSTEIWRVDTSTFAVTPVTVSTGGDQDTPRLSANGRRLVWPAAQDYAGHNADDNGEIFLQDVPGPVVSQVTDTIGGTNFSPDVSGQGNHLAFLSNRNLTGDNPGGAVQVFRAVCGSATPSFVDVPASNHFFEQIEWMTAAEIASGFPGGRFKPVDPVNRQQMANFLYNLAGRPPFTPGSPTFVDVPASNPFFEQIEWMAEEGIARGFPSGRFKPRDAVKRQQMANFLYNLAGQPFFTPPATPTFVDVPTTNPFFEQIEWMADEGIANGFPNGRFKPLDAVKRQQMANFLFNLASGVGVGI
jgi:Tol biopolymer transport system component